MHILYKLLLRRENSTSQIHIVTVLRTLYNWQTNRVHILYEFRLRYLVSFLLNKTARMYEFALCLHIFKSINNAHSCL